MQLELTQTVENITLLQGYDRDLFWQLVFYYMFMKTTYQETHLRIIFVSDKIDTFILCDLTTRTDLINTVSLYRKVKC